MINMKIAIDEAKEGMKKREGGPFGAVILKDGKVIGKGHNRVIAECDPTMHGEMIAIKAACKAIGSRSLKGATLYTTAYPCPMCMGAAMWAEIDKIVYGCTAEDTEAVGFRDEAFYKAIETKEFPCEVICEDRNECLKVFGEYKGDIY
ncbi:MAG: nucleoside deaminase [Ruminococcus sp.]|nr:nucleoside deaminase [Ruminococcus sp.]